MTNKLTEAAQHLGCLPIRIDKWTDNDKYIAQNFIDAYLADQAEREKPIDGWFLQSLKPESQFGEALFTSATFVVPGGSLEIGGVIGDDRGFGIRISGVISTRGQLLDLLRALKGGDA